MIKQESLNNMYPGEIINHYLEKKGTHNITTKVEIMRVPNGWIFTTFHMVVIVPGKHNCVPTSVFVPDNKDIKRIHRDMVKTSTPRY